MSLLLWIPTYSIKHTQWMSQCPSGSELPSGVGCDCLFGVPGQPEEHAFNRISTNLRMAGIGLKDEIRLVRKGRKAQARSHQALLIPLSAK